ncbi:MAG: hypothetical protein LWX83_18830 [Anaerolineae bacterium]|nr:hypothetical protein [Anaerolineae bacterium]
MRYIINIEGQNIEMPEEVASKDETVKQALAPFFPGAANAKITRSVSGDTTTVTVIKIAGTKGNDQFEKLLALPERINPVIDLYNQLREINPVSLSQEETLALSDKLDKAREEGRKQDQAVRDAYGRLINADSQPFGLLISGF